MVPLTALGVLQLVLLLEVKHFVCDGPLQTRRMVEEKSSYGQRLGLVHAGLHGVASLGLLGLLGIGWGLAAGLALAEAAIHYHIDFVKENVAKSAGLTVRDRTFWWLMAGDQALHHVTYLAMAAAVVLWTTP